MGRFYEIDGEQYPSVTTVLQIIRREALERWRGDLGNVEADRQMKGAADIGTGVHRACEIWNKGGTPDVTSALMPMYKAYQDWFLNTVDLTIEPFTEMVVYSKRYRYAGTLDLCTKIKGDTSRSVIDLKTSKAFWPAMALQLAAYREALIDMGHEVNRRLTIRVDKLIEVEGMAKLQIKEYTNHNKDFNAFLCALNLWRYYNNGGH